ncbi:PBECR2 nuclease fold domain-containing protein [Agrobacterium vitis]|uniref:PBECR2 nuclease fold domain-containing protein n=1 Tax=Agrobacterium vitis TaxID=373 RepID=UPI0012E863B9|nr:PBECR2 nuclease fold domain-containing protein [Agrobacterium vitis]MVA40666.1 head morphogenesis protein [Agrobacterium vitis]NSX96943.1 head morphogenesis protein [Agrobacterium vitis]NSZ28082.1 head morphogenesis protein [Agrobacterium vitis]UJL77996.1 head morphogenesis protein [Agrobacterium vitis]UJL83206.1 head morphogenesis protein [Agrobacterium vitis]
MVASLSTRRLNTIRTAIEAASDYPDAARAILTLGAKWTPDALGKLLGDGLELAALHGREAAFTDGEDDDARFADADVFNQPFKEQIDFFTQKRGKPTKAWTDALRGTHDRAFVIAGATDLAMLSDFQTAIASAMQNGTSFADFQKDFDRIVAKYGWAYKGERGWRSRVIFETNLRTSHMAGRLKQMRDPDVLKLRPYWEYRHGETRKPKTPRTQHLAWHGKCYPHDDPFWQTHFPPNDWHCSCGVRSRSLRDLKRMGKDGPDPSPEILTEPMKDPLTGQLIEQPQGVGYGWDYQPGDLWERGLTPSNLMEQGREVLDNPRMAVEIDVAAPLDELLKAAKPFKAKALEDELAPEDYVRAFLEPFGADIGKAVLFEDAAGNRIPVSDLLFRNREGAFKALKRNRHRVMSMMAEALIDPDEIWMGVARKVESGDLVVDRRYIRVDPKTAIQIVFEIGERGWEAITSFDFTDKKGEADFIALQKRRVGKLIYKRPEK